MFELGAPSTLYRSVALASFVIDSVASRVTWSLAEDPVSLARFTIGVVGASVSYVRLGEPPAPPRLPAASA